MLYSVYCSALESLELAGDNNDAWLNLCAKYGNLAQLAPFEVQLLRSSIVGFGRQKQRLSHSSALLFHDVSYLFTSMEMSLKSIEMQEFGDWSLIPGTVDDTLPENFTLINCNNIPNA